MRGASRVRRLLNFGRRLSFPDAGLKDELMVKRYRVTCMSVAAEGRCRRVAREAGMTLI